MENRWSDIEAEALVTRFGEVGVPRDVALCIHGARLLGAEKTLVLHGGGNVSVKTTAMDADGRPVEVLRVKGSGQDMAVLDASGLPAVRLQPLLALAGREGLGEAEMEALQRAHLLDPRAPTPSVEFLLHAFLPRKFIDHTHADAVLALTNQEDWADLCAEAFGSRVALVPYVMSGFALARTASAVFEANPGVDGLVLLKHGLFTTGDTALEAYRRMIELVSLAEARLQRGRRTPLFVPASLPREIAPLAEVAPLVRGLTALVEDQADRHFRPFILDFRNDPEVMAFVGGEEVERLAGLGTATPDYVIRTKMTPLLLPPPEAGRLEAFGAEARQAVERFQDHYRAYFARHNARHGNTKIPADPMPRVVLVPGLGLFGLGATAREAAIAADLALTTVRVVGAAEGIGRYQSIPEACAFDIEYWSPERAKLGQGAVASKPLLGHVVAVTGGASGIGLAAVVAFHAAGAEVVALDLDEAAAEAAAAPLGGRGLGCDVTDPEAVRRAFDRISATFGGLDVVVSNAGAAWQGRIGTVDEAVLRKSFELNFWAHQSVARNAVRIMTAQGIGGCLLFNTSKQAVNPGRDFGPYGLPKAATLFLMKQYALDHGRDGIRANAVNADRIRSGLLTDAMVASRSKARGLSEKDYMSGNLLGVEVTAMDVAQAFVHLALARKTTAAVLTVDGGNIEASLR